VEIRKLLSETEKGLLKASKKKARKSAQVGGAKRVSFPFKEKYTQAIDNLRDAIVLYAYVFKEINAEETQEWARNLYRLTGDIVSWMEASEEGSQKVTNDDPGLEELTQDLEHLLRNPPKLRGEIDDGKIYDELDAALDAKQEPINKYGYELYHILIGAA
jgi:hypothetical protein